MPQLPASISSPVFYLLGLIRATRVQPRLGHRLIRCFGGVQAAVTEFRAVRDAGRCGLKADAAAMLQARLQSNELQQDVERDLAWLQGQGRFFATDAEPWSPASNPPEKMGLCRLPARLREIADPPLGLFCEGDPTMLGLPQIAIVGSRHPSAYGVSVASMLSRALARHGFLITSGLAQGIDGIAHQACLGAGGRTTAVLGTGPDQIYPRQHQRLWQAIIHQGLVVSEFPPGTGVSGPHFPQRNRLVTGLSLGAVIIEARRRSGSMISARLAMEQGREVFAVPGSILSRQSQGCHQLLRDGAKLTAGVADILEELKDDAEMELVRGRGDVPAAGGAVQQTASALTHQQRQVLAALDLESQSADRLCQRLRLPPQTLHAALVCLEIEGLARATITGFELAHTEQFADG